MTKCLAVALILVLTVPLTAQTNTVPVDKIEITLTTLLNYLTAALAVITALLGWWLNNKSKIAALVPVLIKAVESHGTPAQKREIALQAGRLGIEPAMNAQVKALTPVDKPTVIVDGLKL